MNTLKRFAGSWIVLALAATSFAQGGFQNGTFDAPRLAEGWGAPLFSPGDTFITGWTTAPGTNGNYIGAVYYYRDDPMGRRSQDPGGYFVGLGAFSGIHGIQQTFSTIPNQPYLVTFWLSTDPFNGLPGRLRVTAGGSTADYTAGPRNPIMEWQQQAFSFTSDASGSSTLTFQNGARTNPTIDTIAVVPVPEPGIWALLGVGAVIMFLAVRHHGKGAPPQETRRVGSGWGELMVRA